MASGHRSKSKYSAVYIVLGAMNEGFTKWMAFVLRQCALHLFTALISDMSWQQAKQMVSETPHRLAKVVLAKSKGVQAP